MAQPVCDEHGAKSVLGLIRCGFALEAVEEVIPPEKWRIILPDEMRRPMMLLIKARKVE